VRKLDFVVPGDIRTPTGGYIYDREILAGLAELRWRTALHSLDASFPRPTPAALRAARTEFAGLANGSVVVIDGLALPGLDRVLADEARRLDLVALVHHPVALETGLGADEAQRFADAERLALRYVRRVITTSQWTARTLAADGVPIAQLRVAEPGVDRRKTHGSADARGGAHGREVDMLNLLCVATLTPRKGHALLFEALNELRDRRWHLTCAGLARSTSSGRATPQAGRRRSGTSPSTSRTVSPPRRSSGAGSTPSRRRSISMRANCGHRLPMASASDTPAAGAAAPGERQRRAPTGGSA
jgi:glycosyltransferase involved in cell wall biosynthesis